MQVKNIFYFTSVTHVVVVVPTIFEDGFLHIASKNDKNLIRIALVFCVKLEMGQSPNS